MVINMNHKYFLGVDVGGSKTHALITNERGVPVGFGKAGPGNWEIVSYDGLKEALNSCVREALKKANISLRSLDSAGFGIAGYDWESQKPRLIEIIREIGLHQPFEITNDSLIGLLAGSENGWGIALVAGSGCNCRGWDQERREGRIISGDEWAGEGGGGSFLIINALRAIAREFTKRGDKTMLTEIFLSAKQVCSAAALLEGFALERIKIDTNDAPLVFDAEKRGDPIAIAIVEEAGILLGDLACGVIRQLEFENLTFEVILVGSLFEGSDRLNEMMKKTVIAAAPSAQFVRLELPPVIGGILLAMQKIGIPVNKIRHELIENCIDFF